MICAYRKRKYLGPGQNLDAKTQLLDAQRCTENKTKANKIYWQRNMRLTVDITYDGAGT